MKRNICLCAVAILVSIAAAPSVAQKHEHMMKIEGENVYLIQELMLILADVEGAVLVQMDPPKATLTGKYKDIDLKADDKIIMINGKRVKTTVVIKEIYEGLETGDEIKLGVKRDDEMFIVTFEKADPKNASGGMIIRRNVDKGTNEEEN